MTKQQRRSKSQFRNMAKKRGFILRKGKYWKKFVYRTFVFSSKSLTIPYEQSSPSLFLSESNRATT